MLPAARWLVVAVVAIACASCPCAAARPPGPRQRHQRRARSRKRIQASAALAWSGEVHAIGSLEVPLDRLDLRRRLPSARRADRPPGVVAGPGALAPRPAPHERRAGPDPQRFPDGALDLRVQRGAVHAVLRGPAAQRLRRPPRRPGRAGCSPEPGPPSCPGSLPVGSTAAAPSACGSCPRTRVRRSRASTSGPMRTPACPLRVDVYDEGGRNRPILTTQVISLDTDRPDAEVTSFQPVRGMNFSRGAALDEAAGANAYAPVRTSRRGLGPAAARSTRDVRRGRHLRPGPDGAGRDPAAQQDHPGALRPARRQPGRHA